MSRDALSSTSIVLAAVRMADEQGLDALTMRRLGEQMGVKAMALYRYVTGREDLLDAMVTAMLDQLAPMLNLQARASLSCTAYLERTARDVRDLALEHPWLIRLMVSRPAADAALSPPLSGLECTASVLQTLTSRGYEVAASVRTYRAFCAFLLGHLLMEIPLPSEDPNRPAASGRATPTLLALHPQLVDQVGLLTSTDHPAEFERSLSAFLRSVGRLR